MAEKGPTPAGLAYSFFMAIGQRDFEGTKKRVLIHWRDDYYLWNAGVYNKISSNELKALLVKHTSKNKVEPSAKIIDNARLNLMAHCIIPDARIPNSWLTPNEEIKEDDSVIVMNNGLLVLTKEGHVTLQKHTPDFFTLGKIPYGYDPKATCSRWIKFIAESTEGNVELQRLLKQWAGYTISPFAKYQKFLLCLGRAGSGKGTYARVLKAVLGRDNCSDIPLRRFTDKFALYLSYGKKLNVSGDAEQELNPQVEAIIKTWTGEDGMDYEKKYSGGFNADPTAKLMILANNFPAFTDKSDGTWRRLRIAPFDNNPAEVDPELTDKLCSELSGIFNWAIEGLKDLTRCGDFVIPEVSRRAWQTNKDEANPAGMFLGENVAYDETSRGIGPQMLYDMYRKWCYSKGYQALSERTFSREIYRKFPKVEKIQLAGGRTRLYFYTNIKFLPGAEALVLWKQAMKGK